MCGIWGALGYSLQKTTDAELAALVNQLKPRGPEFQTVRRILPQLVFGFTRLAINGLTDQGNQPFTHEPTATTLVCNGEIYNYKQIARERDMDASTLGSDCEVLPDLLAALDPTPALRALDGVFAILCANTATQTLLVARDPYGVRPLFEAVMSDGTRIWSSELKALPLGTEGTEGPQGIQHVAPFPPGTWRKFCLKTGELLASEQYHQIPWIKQPFLDPRVSLRDALVAAVEKRLMSDRPVGALLSGGLDSSLVAAIAARALKVQGQRLHTFSIGMPGSTDLAFARQVADHIGSEHHEILCSKQDFLDAVEPVIAAIESYDITTVRASVGNWLVGKWIRENTDIKVVLNGDGSDEVGGGYLYFFRAPSDEEFEAESERLLKEIHLFDVLRSDRCISAHGLEPRTPFLDKAVVATWRAIPTNLRRPLLGTRPEKWILREAFAGTELLPEAVLWRKKEAFSDGVSSEEESWYQIVSRHAEEHFRSCQAGATGAEKWPHNPPTTAEGAWYRERFESLFGTVAASVIPHMWMPRWIPGSTDPSARILKELYSS